jgi:hypothetical protein
MAKLSFETVHDTRGSSRLRMKVAAKRRNTVGWRFLPRSIVLSSMFTQSQRRPSHSGSVQRDAEEG